MNPPESAGEDRGDRVDFDRRVRLEFRGAQLSLYGDLLVVRKLNDGLGLHVLGKNPDRENCIRPPVRPVCSASMTASYGSTTGLAECRTECPGRSAVPS